MFLVLVSISVAVAIHWLADTFFNVVTIDISATRHFDNYYVLKLFGKIKSCLVYYNLEKVEENSLVIDVWTSLCPSAQKLTVFYSKVLLILTSPRKRAAV